MLEDRTIEVWAYNLETVLAEKLETVVSRMQIMLKRNASSATAELLFHF